MGSANKSLVHLPRNAIQTEISHSLAGRASFFGNIRVHMARQVVRPPLCASVVAYAAGSKDTPAAGFTTILSSVIWIHVGAIPPISRPVRLAVVVQAMALTIETS